MEKGCVYVYVDTKVIATLSLSISLFLSRYCLILLDVNVCICIRVQCVPVYGLRLPAPRSLHLPARLPVRSNRDFEDWKNDRRPSFRFNAIIIVSSRVKFYKDMSVGKFNFSIFAT